MSLLENTRRIKIRWSLSLKMAFEKDAERGGRATKIYSTSSDDTRLISHSNNDNDDDDEVGRKHIFSQRRANFMNDSKISITKLVIHDDKKKNITRIRLNPQWVGPPIK